MSERLRFIISGFFVGLAELLPGISGSTVAVAFNVYDKFILFLANLKLSNLSFNLKKLNEVFFLDLIIPFFLSMVLSVILASNLILYLLSSYTEYFLYFIGVLMCLVSVLIAFRIKEEFGKYIRLNIQFLSGILFGLLLSQFSSTPLDPSPLFIFFMGFIAFSFFLLPGISGSAILLSFGVYEIIIGSIGSINWVILLPFSLGCLISVLTMPKILNRLIKSFKLEIMTFFTALILISGITILPIVTL
ncbi:DUF368 domain-containing protein [Gammaproteobacteria bacterium]|nr:DUF368 domain-containing protein [Gammaproteobacteria bacterium]